VSEMKLNDWILKKRWLGIDQKKKSI
jgi:hypothetical protein